MEDQLVDRLNAANPWWGTPDAIAQDPHIRRFNAGPVYWDPPAMTAMPLAFEDTHTLRGPRQAGKTTTVKRLIQRLLKTGERRILYFSFDAVRQAGSVEAVVRQAKKLHAGPPGPWYIFLDEITSVADWQYEIKHCWDSGLTSDDAIVLTASSARDLRLGTERLPGRRGRGRDFLQLPMSFRDYCLTSGLELADETLLAEEWLTDNGRRLAAQLYHRQDALEAAFERYRHVGGFPAAVRSATLAETAALEGNDPAVLQIFWNVLAGDLARMRRDSLSGLKLLEQVGHSLGSPLKWSNAAETMAVENPITAREYAELLSEIFALLTVYYWDVGRNSLQPKKQRKIYFADPLYARLPSFVVPGTHTAGDHAMVENLVAIGLFRSAAFTLIQAHAIPGAIGYWRSRDGREIDFVAPRVSEWGNPNRLPVEVKGNNETEISAARSAIKRSFQRGLVISRSRFDWNPEVPVLPAWMFLAGLKENTHRPVTFG
jgi:hypothetical protein